MQKGVRFLAVLFAVAVAAAAAIPAFAADQAGPAPANRAQSFEQRQATILKMLDERITSLQDLKTCVQAAKTNEDLRTCHQKQREEMQSQRQEWRKERGMRGPRGGGPGGPGMNQQ